MLLYFFSSTPWFCLLDVISIEKTNETFRLLYDAKGRYTVHRITDAEGKFKLCKVTKKGVGPKGVPYIVTHDARTIRYPDPHVKVYFQRKTWPFFGRMDFGQGLSFQNIDSLSFDWCFAAFYSEIYCENVSISNKIDLEGKKSGRSGGVFSVVRVVSVFYCFH